MVSIRYQRILGENDPQFAKHFDRQNPKVVVSRFEQLAVITLAEYRTIADLPGYSPWDSLLAADLDTSIPERPVNHKGMNGGSRYVPEPVGSPLEAD